MKREIEEYPFPPFLSSHTIDLLTQLCFRKDDLEIPVVDCIFVFGSTVSLDLLSEKIRHLVQKQVSRKMVLTGGNVTYEGAIAYALPQSQMLYERIHSFLPSTMDVLLETSSQNTLENVQLGLYRNNLKNRNFGKEDSQNLYSERGTIAERQGPSENANCEENPTQSKTDSSSCFGINTFRPASVCFVTKNFHCGRSYCTLRRHLPHAALFQCSYAPDFQPETWHQHPLGRARVWGEFLRIKAYGTRGDIAIDECTQLLSDIEKA